jgi:ABC-type Mn2+/Zn2+ transport system permease subunit
LAIGWITATVASVLGPYAAYRLDLRTGAAIVCVLGIALVLAATVARLKKQTDDRRQPQN